MKRVCKRPIQIDALTVCFSVVTPFHYEQLTSLDIDDTYSPYEYKLKRVEGRYYNNVYNIIVIDSDGEAHTFGQLKFNLCRGNISNNTNTDGSIKVWITLSNDTLYCDRFFYLDYIASTLGLELHNITTLDLAFDTPFNVSKTVWRYIRDKRVTTILNGKKVINRDEDRPEISRTISGSLNKDKYVTVNIKQRNAIRDKSKGVTVISYDKIAEIKNISGKKYILNKYNNPKRLYRTEVHLNNEEIKSYMQSTNKELSYFMLSDSKYLEDMFFHFLNSVIRFKKENLPIQWQCILGRVA